MKALYLYPYYYPEEIASSHFNDESDWKNTGIQRLIITPRPTRGIDDATYRKYRHIKREESADGQTVIYRFPMMREGRNPLQRALRYFLCGFKYLHYGFKAKDCDLVCCCSTPPIQGIFGAIIKKRRHIPFVYELQDIFPDSLVGAGLARKDGILWKIGRVVENFTYRNADKILVISEGFKRNIMAKGVPESKIEVSYNCVDAEAVVPVPDEENTLFEEFGISREAFRVVYAGNLGNAQNIDIIMDAARRLKDNPKLQFVIFGTGGLEEEIKATKEREHLDNLKILPLQPYERVSQVYSLGSVCVVSCKSGLGGAAMPSKTWTIMSAGRPVLASFDEGELQDIIEGWSALLKQDGPCGVFTRAGDTDAFCSAILNLCENPDLCRQYGANGRRFILNNLTKEVGTRRYVEAVKSVV